MYSVSLKRDSLMPALSRAEEKYDVQKGKRERKKEEKKGEGKRSLETVTDIFLPRLALTLAHSPPYQKTHNRKKRSLLSWLHKPSSSIAM